MGSRDGRTQLAARALTVGLLLSACATRSPPTLGAGGGAGASTMDAGSGSGGGARAGVGGTSGIDGASSLGGASGTGGAGGSIRPSVTAAPGTTLVKINPAVRHQTFEGWGTSLGWWANHVGGWSADARDAVVEAVVDPATGLGYNLFRYNIGGGENPTHQHMGAFKEMPGFEPSAGTWTWDADANQRAILQRIVERGGTGIFLEAFSNSPPYWMTTSGCASGNTDGTMLTVALR